ncbi:MAG: hypothetical protein AAGF56_08650 [Pseudomonadota bacterium]
MLRKFLLRFKSDEDGAITVDFVVLTAAICLVGFFVLSAIAGGATELANDTQTFLLNQQAN